MQRPYKLGRSGKHAHPVNGVVCGGWGRVVEKAGANYSQAR